MVGSIGQRDVGRGSQTALLSAPSARAARDCRERAAASAWVSEAPRSSLAAGAAGVAYFLLRHAAFGGGGPSLEAAELWADRAVQTRAQEGAFLSAGAAPGSIPGGALQFHEPGAWWVAALVGAASGDRERARSAVDGFVAACNRAAGAPWDVSWGAAGRLLGCAQLMQTLDDPDALRAVEATGRGLRDELVALLAPGDASPAEADVRYLGAAHGWAGIAQALLRFSQVVGERAAPEVMTLLERLIALRRPSGRWPVEAGSREVWLGWCHGSAGWAQTWTLAWQVSGEARMLAFAERSATDAVTSECANVSLCCGRAGQGFAALSLYRATGEQSWLTAAERIASEAARAAADEHVPPHQLFAGELGVALLLTELEDPARSAMPMYESIGPA
jgi:eukaryotic-like serine/threonine-protein kinase